MFGFLFYKPPSEQLPQTLSASARGGRHLLSSCSENGVRHSPLLVESGLSIKVWDFLVVGEAGKLLHNFLRGLGGDGGGNEKKFGFVTAALGIRQQRGQV